MTPWRARRRSRPSLRRAARACHLAFDRSDFGLSPSHVRRPIHVVPPAGSHRTVSASEDRGPSHVESRTIDFARDCDVLHALSRPLLRPCLDAPRFRLPGVGALLRFLHLLLARSARELQCLASSRPGRCPSDRVAVHRAFEHALDPADGMRCHPRTIAAAIRLTEREDVYRDLRRVGRFARVLIRTRAHGCSGPVLHDERLAERVQHLERGDYRRPAQGGVDGGIQCGQSLALE